MKTTDQGSGKCLRKMKKYICSNRKKRKNRKQEEMINKKSEEE
jgi:hypothetical protein